MTENFIKAYDYLEYIQRLIKKTLTQYGRLQYHDIEDLSHDIVIKVANNFEKFNKNSKIETWIASITINHTISFLRKKTTHEIPTDDSTNLITNYNSNNFSSSPESIFISNEENKVIKSYFHNLTDTQQEALYLLLEEKSYEEIANIMGVSVSSIKSLIFRAKQKLKKTVQENKIA